MPFTLKVKPEVDEDDISLTPQLGKVTGDEEPVSQLDSPVRTDFDCCTCLGGSGTTGGTGAIVAGGAVFTIGNGVDSVYLVNHGLATTDVQVELYKISTGETVLATVNRTSSGVLTITFAFAIASNSVRVLVKQTA